MGPTVAVFASRSCRRIDLRRAAAAVAAAWMFAFVAGCTSSRDDAVSRTPDTLASRTIESTAPMSTRPSPVAATLAPLKPIATLGKTAPNGPVLISIQFARGQQQLKPFLPRGRAMYVTFSCLGPGKFGVGSLFNISPCDGQGATVTLAGQAGITQRLLVHADAATTWRLLIMSGA